MTVPPDLSAACAELARRARSASRVLAGAGGAVKDRWLRGCADALVRRQAEVLSANERDLSAARAHGLGAAAVDRLRLTPERLRSAAEGLREVAGLPDPVGQVRESRVRPSGLEV